MTPEEDKENRTWAAIQQAKALAMWMDYTLDVVQFTEPRFAAVDAIGTGAPTRPGRPWLPIVYFIEVSCRRVGMADYPDIYLDSEQYGKILQLKDLTGWQTVLLNCYTDGAFWFLLPDPDRIVGRQAPRAGQPRAKHRLSKEGATRIPNSIFRGWYEE